MLPSEDCDRCFHESNRSGCDVELLPLGGSRWILRAKIGIGVLTGAKLGTGFHTGTTISDRSGKQEIDLASQKVLVQAKQTKLPCHEFHILHSLAYPWF